MHYLNIQQIVASVILPTNTGGYSTRLRRTEDCHRVRVGARNMADVAITGVSSNSCLRVDVKA